MVRMVFRVLTVVLLVILSLRFLRPLSLFWLGMNPGPMHPVNLVFHEAGHALLFWAPTLVHCLGGTIGQLVVPLGLAVAFALKNRSGFDASVCLWWFGQSVADCAPYIADARALRLPLITGYTGAEVEGHDWEYILGQLQMLPWDQELAAGFLWTGRCVMVLALLIGVSSVLFEDVYKRIKGRCDVLLP